MTKFVRCGSYAIAALMGISSLLLPAYAQDYPIKGKPITFIVPYAPGGVTDTGARLMAADLQKELQVPVTIMNRPGAGSQIGLAELVRSPPDGHTIASAALPTVATHYLDPSRDVMYTRKDFAPTAMHHYVPNVIAVRTDSPWKTMKEFVEAARAKPGMVTIADPGALTVPHLMVMQLEKAASVKFNSVHYGGGSLSVTALLGGHVNALAGATADALPHVTSGAWRVLGVAADEPADNMPDAPTMRSQGYDVLAASWSAIVAPAGTQQNVIDVLTKAIAKIIASPEHQKRLHDLGVAPRYLDPAGFTAVWVDSEKRTKEIFDDQAKK